jgi:predicted dithiol-disulfide oxidoreductase (DUF899 family)
MSELFGRGTSSLIVVHYMWGESDDAPCPMCTMWADGYSGALPHIAQRANLVVVAKQSATRFRQFADKRGWHALRALSSAGSTFNIDFGMEDEMGSQFPGVSVFTMAEGGALRHFYTVSAIMGDGHYRGMDQLTPVWNFFDLLPEGRGEWFPSLDYGAR